MIKIIKTRYAQNGLTKTLKVFGILIWKSEYTEELSLSINN